MFVTELNCSLIISCFFIVSEFVDFGDLHTFWQIKKKFDEDTVRLLGAEISFALDYFHTNGIIYRDLKVNKYI